jgi:hypothetical protein
MTASRDRGIASANEAVKDLRPLRGALSRVLDGFVCSGSNPSYGSVPLPVSKKKPELCSEEKLVLV